MEPVRRIRVLAPFAAILVVGAIGLDHPSLLRAGVASWDPPSCPPSRAAPAAGSAWFSLEPRLDGRGWLAGQRLTVGDIAGTITHRMDLPPESFASGPVAGLVLVGDDDGRRSRLRVVDLAAGCATEIGREASVVRSAILAPDGRTSLEHRVSRESRADEGVWRRGIPGGMARRVLPGLPFDERYGPTFTTELALGDDGRFAVSSCAERLCRIRVVEPVTGTVREVDGTGPLVGIAGEQLVAYAACSGFPCRIDAVNLPTGRRTALVDAAGSAALAGHDGRTLVHETVDGGLVSLDLGTLVGTIVPTDIPALPVRRTSRATSGADVSRGELLLAPDGRLAHPATARRLDAVGGVRPLVEVLP